VCFPFPPSFFHLSRLFASQLPVDPLGEEYEMSIDELCEKANFLMDVVERLDHDAMAKYNLGTFTRG
jgi:hypothetical protein